MHRLSTAPARPVLRAHYHVAIARHWAPRLNVTLISGAGPHHGQPAGRVGAPADVVRSTWALARPVTPGVAAPGATVDPSKMRLAAAGAATAAAQAAAQPAPVTTMKSQSGATLAITPVAALLAAGPSRTVVPARRPAEADRRVFHEPARAIASTQPAPPPREVLPSAEVPQRRAAIVRLDEDPAMINRITESVMRQMDRRIQAYRERTGALR